MSDAPAADDGAGSRCPVRVYYEDTDAGGVVYHAAYLRFFERGRTEWLRARGVEQSRLAHDMGIVFAVTAIDVRFRAPARLDDGLIVLTRLIQRRPASAEFSQCLVKEPENRALVTATVRAACLDAASFSVRPLPDEFFRK